MEDYSNHPVSVFVCYLCKSLLYSDKLLKDRLGYEMSK